MPEFQYIKIKKRKLQERGFFQTNKEMSGQSRQDIRKVFGKKNLDNFG